MTEKDFLNRKEEFQSRIGLWTIEIGMEIFADYTIGCFYDKQDNKWKVYVNNERGRHRVRLITSSESEAFDELMSLVEFEVENNKLM